jgi:hypothetical protein
MDQKWFNAADNSKLFAQAWGIATSVNTGRIGFMARVIYPVNKHVISQSAMASFHVSVIDVILTTRWYIVASPSITATCQVFGNSEQMVENTLWRKHAKRGECPSSAPTPALSARTR